MRRTSSARASVTDSAGVASGAMASPAPRSRRCHAEARRRAAPCLRSPSTAASRTLCRLSTRRSCTSSGPRGHCDRLRGTLRPTARWRRTTRTGTRPGPRRSRRTSSTASFDRLWRGMSRGVTRAACLQFEERLQCTRPLHHLGDDARAALCEEARAGPPQRVAAISDCRAAPVFYFFSV